MVSFKIKHFWICFLIHSTSAVPEIPNISNVDEPQNQQGFITSKSPEVTEIKMSATNIISKLEKILKDLEKIKESNKNQATKLDEIEVDLSESHILGAQQEGCECFECLNKIADLEERLNTLINSLNTTPDNHTHSNINEISNSQEESQTTTLEAGCSNDDITIIEMVEYIQKKPKDCVEIQRIFHHSKSGVYKIFPITNNHKSFEIEVYCDLETLGGGWTVIQSRADVTPRVNFYRSWQDYEIGFGEPTTEQWIGLKNIAALTESGNQQLRIELTDWDNFSRDVNYLQFGVSDADKKYRLVVDGIYTGDSLAYANGSAFTTSDQDNDAYPNNCANDKAYRGGWWYPSSCGFSNLNGIHQGRNAYGIMWQHWRGFEYSLKTVKMKIRNRNFHSI